MERTHFKKKLDSTTSSCSHLDWIWNSEPKKVFYSSKQHIGLSFQIPSVASSWIFSPAAQCLVHAVKVAVELTFHWRIILILRRLHQKMSKAGLINQKKTVTSGASETLSAFFVNNEIFHLQEVQDVCSLPLASFTLTTWKTVNYPFAKKVFWEKQLLANKVAAISAEACSLNSKSIVTPQYQSDYLKEKFSAPANSDSHNH